MIKGVRYCKWRSVHEKTIESLNSGEGSIDDDKTNGNDGNDGNDGDVGDEDDGNDGNEDDEDVVDDTGDVEVDVEGDKQTKNKGVNGHYLVTLDPSEEDRQMAADERKAAEKREEDIALNRLISKWEYKITSTRKSLGYFSFITKCHELFIKETDKLLVYYGQVSGCLKGTNKKGVDKVTNITRATAEVSGTSKQKINKLGKIFKQ